MTLGVLTFLALLLFLACLALAWVFVLAAAGVDITAKGRAIKAALISVVSSFFINGAFECVGF